jgi:hypothetical protein
MRDFDVSGYVPTVLGMCFLQHLLDF